MKKIKGEKKNANSLNCLERTLPRQGGLHPWEEMQQWLLDSVFTLRPEGAISDQNTDL